MDGEQHLWPFSIIGIFFLSDFQGGSRSFSVQMMTSSYRVSCVLFGSKVQCVGFSFVVKRSKTKTKQIVSTFFCLPLSAANKIDSRTTTKKIVKWISSTQGLGSFSEILLALKQNKEHWEKHLLLSLFLQNNSHDSEVGRMQVIEQGHPRSPLLQSFQLLRKYSSF